MSQLHQFRLPDVGEGLTEADILRWDVAPGDVVIVNQTLVEVETAKAAVELPSPYAGVVHALHVAEGDTVAVGTPIITIDSGASDGPGEDTEPEPAKREPVLVGYGVGSRGSRRRPSAQGAFDAPGQPPAGQPGELDAEPEPLLRRSTGRGSALAKPPVRLLAKTLAVDIDALVPTGPHGTVSRADVETAAGAVPSQVARPAPGSRAPTGEQEERIPVRGVRKHTAAAVVGSAFTAPHVTEFVTVDVTATMELRDRVAARPEFADVKVSPLLFVARALLRAVPRTPAANASWVATAAGAEIVVKRYVNLGIAAATDRGLVVPNIPGAQLLTLHGLALAIAELTATARAGRTSPAALAGGTITITNIGTFGIDTGTPILAPGEAAILAVGAIRRAPWVVERAGVELIEPRWVLQLALSFDHRLMDGAEGSRFLADIADVLRDPGLALL